MTAEIIPGQPHAEEQHDGAMVLLKVPRAYVKDVKLVLEAHKRATDACTHTDSV
jgi:hypothetical protein